MTPSGAPHWIAVRLEPPAIEKTVSRKRHRRKRSMPQIHSHRWIRADRQACCRSLGTLCRLTITAVIIAGAVFLKWRCLCCWGGVVKADFCIVRESGFGLLRLTLQAADECELTCSVSGSYVPCIFPRYQKGPPVFGAGLAFQDDRNVYSSI
eukprot:1831956-Rhodomonas_salina.3